MSFNRITLVGNLGRDPELRFTPQGAAVCNFTLATNEKRRDKTGDLQDVTTWFRVTLWNKLAENASKYLTKGSQVYIEGRLRIEEWTDRDGKNRFTLEVQATDMQFIGSRAAAEDGPQYPEEFTGGSSSAAKAAAGAGPGDEDIPF